MVADAKVAPSQISKQKNATKIARTKELFRKNSLHFLRVARFGKFNWFATPYIVYILEDINNARNARLVA